MSIHVRDANTTSHTLFQRMTTVTPGGVNSPVRSFNVVGGTPRVIARARGADLWDVDGNRYVDLVCGFGPMIHGHAPPEVTEAIQLACHRGTTYGAPSEPELLLAELVVGRVPTVEMVRMVNSGTEATMTAIRLARGVTGRRLVVKFAGHYHGHTDSLLAQAGSGLGSAGLAASAGVCAGTVSDTIVLPYNDPLAVRELFDARGSEVACVIAEPAAGNMGTVAPRPGFNESLREITADHGALLILDEVMTGFRVSSTGWFGLDGVSADLVTYGKVMAGGLPAAAVAGRADLLEHLAPTGNVYQAGTLSGNPVAMSAGLASLSLATPEAYQTLDDTADRVTGILADAFSTASFPWTIQRAGNMFSVAFTDGPAHDYEQVCNGESWRYPPFFHAMLEGGVYLPPSALETWFVSTAWTEEHFERLASALSSAVVAAERVRGPRHGDRP